MRLWEVLLFYILHDDKLKTENTNVLWWNQCMLLALKGKLLTAAERSKHWLINVM